MKVKKVSRKFFVVSLFCALFSLITVFPTALSAENAPRGWLTKQFTLLNWNIADMPLSPVDHDGICNIIRSIKTQHENDQYPLSIVGIQEDFDSHIFDRLYNNNDFNYFIHPSLATKINFLGDGLAVFSDFLITNPVHVPWVYEANYDLAAQKGFLWSTIRIPVEESNSFVIHVYDLHANAGGPRGDNNIANCQRIDPQEPYNFKDVRELQMCQLKDFMNLHSNGMPVIVHGDFNIHGMNYEDWGDYYILEKLMSDQKLQMVNSRTDKTHPGDNETYDYILFRPGDDNRIRLTSSGYFVGSKAYSDHLRIEAEFNYSVNYDAFPDLKIDEIQFEKMSEGIWNAYITVRNLGPSATPVGIPIRVDIQIAGDKTITGFNFIPALTQDQFATIDIGLENCYPPYGTFTVIATADKLDEIKENNQFNNILQKSFVNGMKPDQPVLLTPPNNFSTCSTIQTFTWKMDTESYPAVDYFQFKLNNPDGTPRHVSPNRKVTNYTPPADVMQNGKNYTWYVRAHNALGWSAWSTGRTIQISSLGVPAQPSLTYPSGGSTISTPVPTLKWTGVVACPAVDYYDIQLNAVDGSDGWVFEHVAGTTYKVPNYYLVNGQTYECFVRAHNSKGWGNWSVRRTFKVQF